MLIHSSLYYIMRFLTYFFVPVAQQLAACRVRQIIPRWLRRIYGKLVCKQLTYYDNLSVRTYVLCRSLSCKLALVVHPPSSPQPDRSWNPSHYHHQLTDKDEKEQKADALYFPLEISRHIKARGIGKVVFLFLYKSSILIFCFLFSSLSKVLLLLPFPS